MSVVCDESRGFNEMSSDCSHASCPPPPPPPPGSGGACAANGDTPKKKVCQNVTKHDLEMIAFIKLVLRDGIRHVSPVGWRLPTTVLPK